jgi:fatty-acyl-CoA synthase
MPFRRKKVEGFVEIRSHAAAHPGKPAIVVHPSARVVTFAELEASANRLAHYFRTAGLRNGDAIAILMENNEHMLAVMWAARRAGLYYVPINTHLTAAEAAYIVDNSNAVGIIGSAALRATLERIGDHLPGGLPELVMIADDHLDGWLRYPECVADQPHTPIDDEFEGELLQYSSGTTGRPKGIRRELSGLPPSAAPLVLTPLFSAMGIGPRTVYLTPAPLYHTAPSMWSMSAQAVGATVVVMEKFDAEGCLDAIQRYGVTHGQFVPSMFVRMLKLPEPVRCSYDVATLSRVVHAAAPCPVEIKKQMIAWWGPIVEEFYSSSEGAGITYITADEWLARPGSVGRALLGTAHIVGDDGTELPAHQPGEIYFEGGFAFDYLNDAAKTDASRNAQGWTTVGDIGYLDDDGYLFLTDRRHHMIISGGVNIYPQEAEDMLVTHPKVMDAAVFGIPHDEMGQSVMAVVQTVDGNDATEDFAEELSTWLRDRLAHYKCPRTIAFEPQLPRTDAGKLYKQELVTKYSEVLPITKETR